MSYRWLIGLSSGSSCNGVDAALVEASGAGTDLRLRLTHFLHQPYQRELRELLLRSLSNRSLSLRQVSLLHRVLGEAFASACRQLADQAQVPLARVFALGLPGHTLCHDPESKWPSTLTLGMAGVVSERTGLTTVSDFRSRDIVLGGQGFPLTPWVDRLLFHHPSEHRLLIHLGGLATVLSLPPGADPRETIGFQAAPCTLVLDGLMRLLTNGREAYDAGGKHAVQGCCIDALLEKWLQHPLLQKKPPKSLPREEWGEEFLQQVVHQARQMNRNLHDVLCTATHFVARAILEAVQRFVPRQAQRVLFSGGGVKNGLLWRLLEQHLAPAPVERIDTHGVPAEARKAIAFAGLAALTLDGVPANFPSVTGAQGPRLLGSVTPGSSANWARCLAWMAAQTAPWRLAA